LTHKLNNYQSNKDFKHRSESFLEPEQGSNRGLGKATSSGFPDKKISEFWSIASQIM